MAGLFSKIVGVGRAAISLCSLPTHARMYLCDVITVLNQLNLIPFQDNICPSRSETLFCQQLRMFSCVWGKVLLFAWWGLQMLPLWLLWSTLGPAVVTASSSRGATEVLTWGRHQHAWPWLLAECLQHMNVCSVAKDTLPTQDPRILIASMKIIWYNQWRSEVCSYCTHLHRHTCSCSHLLCAMVSESEQTSLLVRHSGVSASGDGYKCGFLQLCSARPPPAAWNNMWLPQHDI